MKGSTNAKPQLLLPVITGEHCPHLGSCAMAQALCACDTAGKAGHSHGALQASPRLE